MKRWLSTLVLLTAALLCSGATIVINGPQVPAAAGGSIDLTLSSASAASGSTTTVVNVPSGVVDGRFLIGFVCVHDAVGAPLPITLPSGWTSIVQTLDPGQRVSDCHLAYRRASSEPASYTWTHGDTTGGNGMGVIWQLSGVVASGNPESGTRSVVHDNVGGLTFDVAGMTTVDANAAVIAIRAHRAAAVTMSGGTLGGTSITERVEVDKITISARIQAAAGATGNFAGTDSVDNDRTMFVFALKP